MKWPFSRSKSRKKSEDVLKDSFERITSKDGAEMVFILAGEFEMGDSLDGMRDALPVHTVCLDAFYMDVYAVTNAQYRKFIDATGHREPEYWDSPDLNVYWDSPDFNAPDHPVVGVSWNDAVAYAEWAGKQLPTEAQWEKAARGGLQGKRYPWGNEISHNYANYGGTGGKDVWSNTSPVGSFAPNGYGLYDMAGNVYEWCADWYDDGYYANSPYNNPLGPDSGSSRVLRGGGWYFDSNYLFVAWRSRDYYSVTFPKRDHGFRCSASRSD